jgi:hypothetical protein
MKTPFLRLRALSTDIANRLDLSNKPLTLLISVIALLTTGLVIFSQTKAFHEDEGYHLLTAHLINQGERPYLDFVFPQPPLNAYLNAAWMRVFGESWHAAHVLASLETAAAIFLTAWFVLTRFPVIGWRLAGAIAVTLLVGLNMLVLDFGTIAQAYGICLLLTVAAFFVSAVSVDKKGLMVTGLAGLLAGAAASSSLLTASAGWVLLVWIFCYNRVGNRIAKSCAFIVGATIAFVPVLRPFVNGPRQVWFNLFQFHLSYRQVDWPGATQHDIDTLTSWISNSQDLCLILLALAGVLFLIKERQWNRPRRAEFYLCAVLALAMGIQNSFAHPTFRQYFVMLIPFVAILASLGLYSIALRAGFLARPFRLVLTLMLLLCLQLARSIYDEYHSENWHDWKAIASKVDEVTAPQATLLADEQIYFLTHRPPPSGMEYHDSHKVDFSPAVNAMFHILPQAELDRQIKAGAFSTIQTCDEDMIDRLALEDRYEQRSDFPTGDSLCSVFWQWTTEPATAPDTEK